MKYKVYLQHEETGNITSLVFDYAALFTGNAKIEIEKFGHRWYVIGKSMCTGLNTSFGQKMIFENDIFKYENHPKYLLDSFIGQVVWMPEYACFGYIVKDKINSFPTAFSKHDEIENDFLSHCKIVGNTFENANLFECHTA